MRIYTQAEQFPARVAAIWAAMDCNAIPEHITPEWAGNVWNRIMRDPGGITFRDNPGDEPDRGFMVSVPGREETVPFHMLTPVDIEEYAEGHRDDINDDPDNFYGGWRSPGRDDPRLQWYQDVSHHNLNPWETAENAMSGNQQAVYDYNQGNQVATDDLVSQLYYTPEDMSVKGRGIWMARRGP